MKYLNDYYSFHFINGQTARSLSELYDIIKYCPIDLFSYHYKHLSSWIANCLELRHLAADIDLISNQKLPFDLLRKYMIYEFYDHIHRKKKSPSVNPEKHSSPIRTYQSLTKINEEIEYSEPLKAMTDVDAVSPDDVNIEPRPEWNNTDQIRVWTTNKAPKEILEIISDVENVKWVSYIPDSYRSEIVPWLECVHYGSVKIITIPCENGNLNISYK